MKYILTQQDNTILGPFLTATSEPDGYLCDNTLYRTDNFGICTISEVADDYMTLEQIAVYNNSQSDLRAKAYPTESDPIFFQWQRGLKTEKEWLDAIDIIKTKYPYKDIA
jgi:hypothetical protein